MTKPKLLALIGPTAVGKTALSLELAQRFQCEIISADSMQVYRGMNIGTAKATVEERALVPHHLIDILNPDEKYTVTEFQEHVGHLIPNINDRGHLPFLVGGTGLYVQSVLYGYEFSEGGSDDHFRGKWSAFAEKHGGEALLQELHRYDPESAERLHPNNVRRIIRAMEIYHLTGKTMSEHLQSQRRESPYDYILIGLTRDRQQLYERVNRRVDAMIVEGLVDEVRGLLDAGYSSDLPAMQGLGYREICSYLEGQMSLGEAVEQLKQNTRRYAKRQWTWFRRMEDIHWLDLTDPASYDKHVRTICEIIAGKFECDREYNPDNVTI
jgi:tRNA dimethylallyltransferase